MILQISHNFTRNRLTMKMLYHFLFLLAAVLYQSCSNVKQDHGTVWKRHIIDNSFSGADGVRLADINGDVLPDIATGWEESGFTKVYLNPGPESVREPWPSVFTGVTPSVEDAFFVDLDADGFYDVVSCTEGANRKVYFSWGPANFDYVLDSARWNTEVLTASDGLMQWMYGVPVQLDGVNGVDIVAGSKGRDAMIGWFKSPEKARDMAAWQWFPISPATWIMSIIIRDMDGDGDQDIVVSDRKPGATNGVRWLENPGLEDLENGALWKNHFIGGQGVEVMFMDLGDLDGDGLEDAIVCERTNQEIIFWRRLDASGKNWQEHYVKLPEVVGLAKSVYIDDVNGDGKKDVVVTSYPEENPECEGVVWFSFNESPMEESWHWYHLSGTEGKKFDRLEMRDLDGDGDLDVITCEENFGEDSWGLGLIWYENPLR